MDSEEDFNNNPWAQYIRSSRENLDDLDTILGVHSKDYTNSKLLPDDKDLYDLYGSYPVFEELYLISCKVCNVVLIPSALMSHMEQRHGTKEVNRTVTPVSSTSTSVSSSNNASSSRSCSSTTPAWDKGSDWTMDKNVSSGALQKSLNVNTSANIVRVKPQNSKLKDGTALCHKLEKPSYLMLKKNMLTKKELSQSPKSVLMLPELSSNIPSTSTDILPSTSNSSQPCQTFPSAESSFNKNLVHSSLSPQPSSSSSVEKPVDNSDASSSSGKKTPTLEKLVLRRVLQTNEKSPAVRRQSVEGMKGVARNKKDSAKEPYFMVVKSKDRQQNLLAARQQIRKQSNEVHQEKDKVELKMRHLEGVRDKLINQLFQELQSVKKKLHECNIYKSTLQKELLAARGQIEKTKELEEQNRRLTKENAEYHRQLKELQQQLDKMHTNANNLMEQHRHMHSIEACAFSEEKMAKQLQESEEQKYLAEKRKEEAEIELREFKKSTMLQQGDMDIRLKQCVRLSSDLKKELAKQLQVNHHLRTENIMLEKYFPEDVLFHLKTQFAAEIANNPSKLYESLMQTQSNVPTTVPVTEKLLTDIEYLPFQHQVPTDMNELYQQVDEEVS